MKKNVLFIDAGRQGYEPEQCGTTMTAAKLIELLGNYEGDTPIYIRNDGGYTYGTLEEADVVSREEEMEYE